MGEGLRRLWRATPTSCLLVAIAVGVQVAVGVVGALDPDRFHEAHRVVGAARSLVVVAKPELHGLLEVWDGEWWRVLVSPFHHGSLFEVPPRSLAARLHLGDLPHLVMNAAALLFLGSLLEPRLRRRVYLPFVLLSLPVAFLPEYLLGHAPVGLSGVAYAMFGLAVVLRTRDRDLSERMPPGIVRFGFAWLVIGVLLTAAGAVSIANVAHAAGLAYGAAWGGVLVARPERRRWLVVAGVLAHGLLPVGFWFVAHPVWIGRYHWYTAEQATTVEGRRQRLARAVELDPTLEGAWLELAGVEARAERFPSAWRTLVVAVDHHRSSEKLVKGAHEVWRALDAEQRTAAREEVARQFGPEADEWERRLIPAATVAVGPPDPSRPRLPFAGFTRPWFEPLVPRDLRAPEVDPEAEDSAALGTRL